MWKRDECAICRTNFGIHPKAKTFLTTSLCVQCRKVPTFIKRWGTNKITFGVSKTRD